MSLTIIIVAFIIIVSVVYFGFFNKKNRNDKR